MVDSYLFCLVFLLRKECNVAEVYHKIGSVCSHLMKLELNIKIIQERALKVIQLWNRVMEL